MKKLPDIDMPSQLIHIMMNGRVETQMLLTGIELGIFDCLSSCKSCKEVADELHLHPANTEFLLNALCAGGLLQKEHDAYQNRAETETALCRKNMAYIGELLTKTSAMAADSITNMTDRVRFGPPGGAFDFADQSMWAEYARAMGNYQLGGIVQKTARIMAGLDGFAAFKKMLDLGGAHGLFCIAMVAEHPSMRGVVFDQPAVVTVTEEFISEYGMQDRISVLAGDYTIDSLEEGYDLVWASATLNFARSNLAGMMNRIFEALRPGGIFVSMAEGVTEERTQPSVLILQNLPFALMGQDMMFNRGEIAEAMRMAGFASIESRRVETPMLPMELDIARKAA
jgi:predicted O-methyltransferase YrrM